MTKVPEKARSEAGSSVRASSASASRRPRRWPVVGNSFRSARCAAPQWCTYKRAANVDGLVMVEGARRSGSEYEKHNTHRVMTASHITRTGLQVLGVLFSLKPGHLVSLCLRANKHAAQKSTTPCMHLVGSTVVQ